MNDHHFLVKVYFGSGQMQTAIWVGEKDQDADGVQDEILGLLQEHPREFLALGDIIVHTGAISSVIVEPN